MKRALVAAMLCGLVGCARSHVADPMQPVEYDPLQNVNRKIFWFNDKVDGWALEPVARGWDKIAPDRVQQSISNFFQNLRFPIVATNDLLQGKVVASASDVGRFGVNTTVGVLGFFDPASRWGLVKHDEDFGQTLGVWGVPPGPYLVLPLFGPSNFRDAGGLGVDSVASITPWFVDWWILAVAQMTDVVNERSLVLEQVKNAKEASFDYYVFVRNAYIQHRAAQVADRAPSAQPGENELYYPDTPEETRP